jgi:iduronate 2-sulfatase
MSRCRLSCSLVLAVLIAAPAAAAEVRGGRPNILFLAVDDLKPALGCYGDPIAKSPNLDRLAARGMLFQNAYVNQAVCAASRNNLMVGSYSTTLGIYDLRTNFRRAVPDAVTLPQYFRQHGWRSEGIGKLFHVGHGNVEDPVSWSVPHFHDKVIDYALPASTGGGRLTREEAFFSNSHLGQIQSLPRGAAWEAADVPDNAYTDGRIADEAIRRLDAARERPDVPFFLALGFVKPHLPFCAPKKYWDLYDRDALPLADRRTPPEGAPAWAGKTLGELNQYEPIPEQPPLSDDLQRTLIHGYYACISYVDAQIGRVLDELDRQQLAGNTIIVLWGDHGWHLGDHGMWTKHTNYEQATHIPLLIVAPGVTRPGSRTAALAETVDLYPTLCELAGLPKPIVPQSLDGRSLVPVLRDPTTALKDHIIHVYPRKRSGRDILGRAIRTARHRLVEWKAPGASADTAAFELYDYESDPGETRNLAEARPDVVDELRRLLATHPEARPQIDAAPPQVRKKKATDAP